MFDKICSRIIGGISTSILLSSANTGCRGSNGEIVNNTFLPIILFHFCLNRV